MPFESDPFDFTEVWPDGTTVSHFEFRHALYQEVLSQRVSATRRMRLQQLLSVTCSPVI